MRTIKDNKPEEMEEARARFAEIASSRMDVRKILTVLGLTPRVFALAWRITPWQILLLILLRALDALMPIVQLWLGKLLIDSIIAYVAHPSGSRGMAFIFGIVGAHGALAVLSNALMQLHVYVQDNVGRRLALHSEFLLREKTLDLDLAMLENPKFHDQYQRASLGAGSKPLSLVNEAMNVVQNAITLISLGAVFLAFKWPIAVILAATAVPNVYVLLKYSQKSYEVQRVRTHDGRRAVYHASLLAVPQSFKEIKILQIGRLLLENFRQFRWREFREDRTLLRRRQIEGLVTGVVATSAYYGAYVYIVYEALRGHISIGDVAFYSGAFARCQGAIKALVMAVPHAHGTNVYVRDFLELQQVQPELVKTSGTAPVVRPVRTIEFRNVSFRYPRTESWVLKDVNLTFRQGERIGLIGENGAGKTTLVKLLCRLYDPTEGSITVNGVDLRELSLEKWHESIGVIFQDFVTYMDRVRDNIGYGQVDQMDNLPRIIEAAKRGQADAFIRALPGGYETILGREFAKGEWLSGGQMQRLALSRLFMRDADVLILDEPTFALDPRTEYEIYETFNKHCDGRIALLISHRFSTIRVADRIIVLSNRVVEDGTHDDLVHLGGVYAELFDIQSRTLWRDTEGKRLVTGRMRSEPLCTEQTT